MTSPGIVSDHVVGSADIRCVCTQLQRLESAIVGIIMQAHLAGTIIVARAYIPLLSYRAVADGEGRVIV